MKVWGLGFKGPCSQIVYILGPMYLKSEYFKANVYTIWVRGPLQILGRRFFKVLGFNVGS